MTDPDAPIQGEKFDLVAEILTAFDFLIKEYSFRVAEIRPTWPNWVKYESRRTYVYIGDERMHYDLDVSVSLRRTTWHPETGAYSIHQILEVANAPVPRELWNFQTSSDEIAKKFLRRMAEYLKAYGRPALLGDRAFFRKLQERNSQRFLEHQIEIVHNRAQESWEKKDYRKAAELYGSIAGHLSSAEDKKRLYSLRKLKEAGKD